MTIRHMKIFAKLVDCGCNTTRAAEELNMTQPGVSLALKEMEEHYGVRFFDRIGRKLVLNEAGKQYLDSARHILSLFDAMELKIGNWEDEGILRVGSSITIGSRLLPSYIAVFSALHPRLDIRVSIAPSGILEEALLEDKVDIALLEGAVHDSRLIETEYMDDDLVAICSSKGPYGHGSVISLPEFRKCRFLLREKGSGTRDTFDLACAERGFSIETVWESYSTSAIVEAVVMGIGVAVLPRRLLASVAERGEVNIFHVESLDFTRRFRVVHHRDKLLGKTLSAFIAFVMDYEENYPLPRMHGLF